MLTEHTSSPGRYPERPHNSINSSLSSSGQSCVKEVQSCKKSISTIYKSLLSAYILGWQSCRCVEIYCVMQDFMGVKRCCVYGGTGKGLSITNWLKGTHWSMRNSMFNRWNDSKWLLKKKDLIGSMVFFWGMATSSFISPISPKRPFKRLAGKCCHICRTRQVDFDFLNPF